MPIRGHARRERTAYAMDSPFPSDLPDDIIKRCSSGAAAMLGREQLVAEPVFGPSGDLNSEAKRRTDPFEVGGPGNGRSPTFDEGFRPDALAGIAAVVPFGRF